MRAAHNRTNKCPCLSQRGVRRRFPPAGMLVVVLRLGASPTLNSNIHEPRARAQLALCLAVPPLYFPSLARAHHSVIATEHAGVHGTPPACLPHPPAPPPPAPYCHGCDRLLRRRDSHLHL
eukprot:scaffold9090_cov138-Isochrysis_galbana.AAC.2